MANPYFRFKQFTVYHDKCAMKVGTDGVLLGVWADVRNCKTILDVGSGSGLIALMAAQRSNATIDAVEIDKDAYLQSLENISKSGFGERIKIYLVPFSDYSAQTEQKYDLIISNPPYFSRSLPPSDHKRKLARHDTELTLNELISGCSRLLKETGKAAFILPVSAEPDLIEFAEKYNLHILRKTKVKPTPTSNPKRILIELGKEKSEIEENELVIELERHVYSEKYKLLTRDFYLDP